MGFERIEKPIEKGVGHDLGILFFSFRRYYRMCCHCRISERKIMRYICFLIVFICNAALAVPPTIKTVPPDAQWAHGSTKYGTVGGIDNVRAQFPGICAAVMTSVGRAGPYGGTPTPMTGYNGYCTAGTGVMTSQEYVRIVPVCLLGNLTGSAWGSYACSGVPTCPDGYELSSDKSDCKAPVPCPLYNGSEIDMMSKPVGCECPAGTAWQAYSGCRKKCAWAANENINAGWDFEYNPGGAACAMGCEATAGAGTFYKLPNGNRMGPLASTGWACKGTTQTATEPDNSTDRGKPEDKKKPPCESSQGVLTSSAGKIACVPEGVPSRKPEVEKKKRTETYPDQTQKEIETIKTTDPGTGAYDETTTTRTTSGGSTTTTTSSESGTGKDGNGDGVGDGNGNCEGDKCGGEGRGEYPGVGDLYEKGEKTMSSVFSDFSNGVKDTALGKSVSDFFKVTVSGGSCPAWTVNVEFLKTTLDIGQYFCNQAAIGYLQTFGNVLLIVVSFIAFSWAIL